MRAKVLLVTAVAAALAIPAIAQEAVQPAQQPPAQQPAVQQPSGAQSAQQAPATASPVRRAPGPRAAPAGGEDFGIAELSIEELAMLQLPEAPPPVEIPDHARRDVAVVGGLDPVQLGLRANPWGGANGAFLSGLMRRMETPIASRWAHIALRNAVFARARNPRLVNPVDWTAERAWLLLRMGEADAARLLVSGVDVDKFTPKMFQVGMQSALANADPSGLCPLQEGLREVEERVLPLVDAMCAALSGEPESAASQLESVRRRGRISGIDLVLAQKVVGAGADTGRAVTVEWDPVERLNAWRFGLATSTGMTPPDRLMRNAASQLRAWHARAPLIPPQQRLESARIAAGMGVLSSQALTDIYSLIYEATDPNDLSGTDAWQLRLAFTGRDLNARLDAMRRFWRDDADALRNEAGRAVVGRAAALVPPGSELQEDAPNLIRSILAAGLDGEAAQWVGALRGMDDRFADESWAMLALGAPATQGLDFSIGRINAFVGRDNSPRKHRSAMLVAGLAGLGRIDGSTADRLNRRHGLGIQRRSRWTRMIDRSAELGQPGTVLVMIGTGFQTPSLEQLPSSHLFHAIAALNRTGQGFTARMIAAEALSRT